MSNRFFLKLILGCFFSLTHSIFAEDGSDTGENAQKIIKVSTLSSVESNQEFQRNVQLIRTQRQQLVKLKAQLDETENENEKSDVETTIDELLKKLNDNNEIMFKTYGFSLNRNYTMVIEKSHIYMMVTEDEAKKFEDEHAKREESQTPGINE